MQWLKPLGENFVDRISKHVTRLQVGGIKACGLRLLQRHRQHVEMDVGPVYGQKSFAMLTPWLLR
jgi:hypothetical protein